jgi:hypothetical protein
MAIHIIQIEKHRFVCGLFWQSLSRPRELAREARELGAKIDSDLYVLRTDQSTAQAGFGQSADGARRGMFSLGAIISKTLALEGAYFDGEKQRVHNWLAALRLPDGMWAYFAARDANFLPNGDFAGTREEVMERLHSDYGLGGWNVVLGDAELADYGFHNFEARTVESFIPHRKDGRIRAHRWWGLQPVHTRGNRWPALAAAVLALALAGGWVHVQRLRAEQRAAQAAEEARIAERQAVLRRAAPSVQPPPWGGKPTPTSLARACVDGLGHLAAGGWLLDEYVCTADTASYAWSRHGSTLDLLRAEVPNAVFDLGGEKATLAVPLRLERRPPEALLERRALMEPIISELQHMGIAFRIASVPPAAATQQAQTQTRPPAPQWQAYSFSCDSQGLLPTALAELLDRPGVRIDRIVNRAGHWSIEGVMYVK